MSINCLNFVVFFIFIPLLVVFCFEKSQKRLSIIILVIASVFPSSCSFHKKKKKRNKQKKLCQNKLKWKERRKSKNGKIVMLCKVEDERAKYELNCWERENSICFLLLDYIQILFYIFNFRKKNMKIPFLNPDGTRIEFFKSNTLRRKEKIDRSYQSQRFKIIVNFSIWQILLILL